MGKIKYEVDFKQRFHSDIKGCRQLASDLEKIFSLPFPIKKIAAFGGGEVKTVRVEVSANDSGRPPFLYSVSYENELYNKGSASPHRSLHEVVYTSSKLKRK